MTEQSIENSIRPADKPRLTVVIPVRNCEKYIARCIDSVLAQTYTDFELLILDNASTDKTPEIIGAYAARYPNLIYLDRHDNVGCAGNRNLGIDLARGEYLMIIDADDEVLPDYCEVFVREIEEGGWDEVAGGWLRTNETGRVVKKVLPRATKWSKYLLVTPWAKISRVDFLRKHGIRFVGAYGEDVVFCLHTIFTTERIKTIRYAGYKWFINEESVTATEYKGFSGGNHILPMLAHLKALRDEGDDYLDYFLVRSVIYYLLIFGKHGKPEEFVAIAGESFDWLGRNYPGTVHCRYLLWGPDGEYFLVNIVVLVFMLIRKFHLLKVFAGIYCKG
jgi:glycosyltransferase involved in cell wall biosynthesis